MNRANEDRDPFDEVAESFLERFRAGERPSVTEYAERYPQLADQIRDLLPALIAVEKAGPKLGHDRRFGRPRLVSRGLRPLAGRSRGQRQACQQPLEQVRRLLPEESLRRRNRCR